MRTTDVHELPPSIALQPGRNVTTGLLPAYIRMLQNVSRVAAQPAPSNRRALALHLALNSCHGPNVGNKGLAARRPAVLGVRVWIEGGTENRHYAEDEHDGQQCRVGRPTYGCTPAEGRQQHQHIEPTAMLPIDRVSRDVRDTRRSDAAFWRPR